MSTESAFELLRPPVEGFHAEDLDRMSELPPHTELIDGSLILVSPQKAFHALVIEVLLAALRGAAPEDYRVRREMNVVLGPRQRPEPDLMVIRQSAVTDEDQTWFPADAVELIVEVVFQESEERDGHRKPQLYAQAGIPTSGGSNRSPALQWSAPTCSIRRPPTTAGPAFTPAACRFRSLSLSTSISPRSSGCEPAAVGAGPGTPRLCGARATPPGA